MKKFAICLNLALGILGTSILAHRGEAAVDSATDQPIEIRIKGHKFYPDKVTVKAGTRFKLKIINEDPTSEEFESTTMVVEKFLGPKRKMVITLGPLKKGEYKFFGELNMATAQGVVHAE